LREREREREREIERVCICFLPVLFQVWESLILPFQDPEEGRDGHCGEEYKQESLDGVSRKGCSYCFKDFPVLVIEPQAVGKHSVTELHSQFKVLKVSKAKQTSKQKQLGDEASVCD
jgi:hypothetical protein